MGRMAVLSLSTLLLQVIWNEAAVEAVVAHEKINAAILEEKRSTSYG